MIWIIVNLLLFAFNSFLCYNNYNERNYETALLNSFSMGINITAIIVLILLNVFL
jgi:hypothetical protein